MNSTSARQRHYRHTDNTFLGDSAESPTYDKSSDPLLGSKYTKLSSSASSANNITYINNTHDYIPNNDDISKSDHNHKIISSSKREIKILGVDISHYSSTVQFMILMGGLLFFMCLYGYLQELVIYGWFNRKLSLFSTFMHFLGCSIFALINRRSSSSSHHHHSHNTHSNHITNTNTTTTTTTSPHTESIHTYDNIKYHNNNDNITLNNTTNTSNSNSNNDNINKSKHNSWFSKLLSYCHISMGTASPHVAFSYYSLQILLKTVTQNFANLSMSQINYPAKVLFKSANPVVTMIIGLIWFHKTYKLLDYIVVLLLLLGLYIFITTDTANSPKGTSIGILFVTLSMFFGASVPMVQEHCMNTYHANVEELLYYSFLGSTVISFICALIAGEVFQGFYFLYTSGSIKTWIEFGLFTSVGFYGANFSTMLTKRFGSLVNQVANTVRKAITLGLSYVLFPERNILTTNHIIGASIFIFGLLLRILIKENSIWFMSLEHYICKKLCGCKKEHDKKSNHSSYEDIVSLSPINTYDRNTDYTSTHHVPYTTGTTATSTGVYKDRQQSTLLDVTTTSTNNNNNNNNNSNGIYRKQINKSIDLESGPNSNNNNTNTNTTTASTNMTNSNSYNNHIRGLDTTDSDDKNSDMNSTNNDENSDSSVLLNDDLDEQEAESEIHHLLHPSPTHNHTTTTNTTYTTTTTSNTSNTGANHINSNNDNSIYSSSSNNRDKNNEHITGIKITSSPQRFRFF